MLIWFLSTVIKYSSKTKKHPGHIWWSLNLWYLSISNLSLIPFNVKIKITVSHLYGSMLNCLKECSKSKMYTHLVKKIKAQHVLILNYVSRQPTFPMSFVLHVMESSRSLLTSWSRGASNVVLHVRESSRSLVTSWSRGASNVVLHVRESSRSLVTSWSRGANMGRWPMVSGTGRFGSTRQTSTSSGIHGMFHSFTTCSHQKCSQWCIDCVSFTLAIRPH